jgi:hypothetical protein
MIYAYVIGGPLDGQQVDTGLPERLRRTLEAVEEPRAPLADPSEVTALAFRPVHYRHYSIRQPLFPGPPGSSPVREWHFRQPLFPGPPGSSPVREWHFYVADKLTDEEALPLAQAAIDDCRAIDYAGPS